MSKTTGSHGIKPLFDYVLIKPVESESKTASGIYIPDTAKEKPSIGEVMAIGPGNGECCGECGGEEGACCESDMVVKVGQKVLYKKWSGNEVKVQNEEWFLIQQKDIMAIVE